MTTTSKVALITGAGSGIGKAVTLAFLREGYSVVLAGRREDALEAVVKESGSSKALAVATDVSRAESVAALFVKIKDTFGRIDVIFKTPVLAVLAPALKTSLLTPGKTSSIRT